MVRRNLGSFVLEGVRDRFELRCMSFHSYLSFVPAHPGSNCSFSLK